MLTNFKERNRGLGGSEFLFKTAEVGRSIDLRIFHNPGGMNYYNYETEIRGIYLSVLPVERVDGSERFMMGDGGKLMLEATPRRSAKKMSEWAARLDAIAPELAELYKAGNQAALITRVRMLEGVAQ